MAVRKRSSVWWYDFMIRGVRYRSGIPEATTKKDALDAEAVARREVYEGRYGKPTGDTLFSAYADDFLVWSKENKRSWRDDQWRLEVLKAVFGSKRLNEISPISIEKFKRDRRGTPTKHETQRKPSSVNRELELLSRIFNMAIRDGVAASNPCRSVQRYREENKRVRYLTTEEEARLLSALDGSRAHLRPVVVMAIHTGMRRRELLSLTWLQVDFRTGSIWLPVTKSGKARFVPMNAVVRAELEALRNEDSRFVFPSPKRKGVPITDVKKGFSAACEAAGITNLHFHDLRHTTGTRMGEMGVDPFTIADVLGHSDVRMTARYTHATDRAKRQAVEGLSRYQGETVCHDFVTIKNQRQAG